MLIVYIDSFAFSCYFSFDNLQLRVLTLQRNYDVIIVGAGPAGATLAYELARKDVSVLVLEKAELPRYKCCAGGITVKAAGLLDIDLDEIMEDEIHGLTVTFKGGIPFQGTYPEVVMYTIIREKFDYALVKRAEGAGATIIQGAEVGEIRSDNTGVEVSTTNGNFRSQLIAGADGARGVVAKGLGLKTKYSQVIAIQTEVVVEDKELAKWKSQVAIDIGRISSGYSWVFPKSNHLSIGIACLANKAKELRRHYREFINSLNLGNYTVSRWNGGILPICTGKAALVQGKGVFLGDAAGLADPLTGEGIHNAVLSAQLAAPAIERALQSGEECLDDYRRAVEEKIIPEMKIAWTFFRVFSLFPYQLTGLIKRDERLWRGCCYLLRGEIDYTTVRERIKDLGGIYRLLFGK